MGSSLLKLLTIVSLLCSSISVSAQTTICPSTLSNITTPGLNLTAISTNNGSSVLECWQLPGFVASSGAGTVGALNLALGNLSNATYTVIPARFNGGLHKAPANQFVVFLSGLVHVTLPNSTADAWVEGGKYGVIIAADAGPESKLGHISTYPSDADTVALQIPFEAGTIPEHSVLHSGPCTWPDMVGI